MTRLFKNFGPLQNVNKVTLWCPLNDSWILPTFKKTVRHIPKILEFVSSHSDAASLRFVDLFHTPCIYSASFTGQKRRRMFAKSMFTLDNRLRYFMDIFPASPLILSVDLFLSRRALRENRRRRWEG
jgi:hypothetical protein